MLDDSVIVTIERLRDDLAEFRSALRKDYTNPNQQVVGQNFKKKAAELAEKWMVDLNLAQRPEVIEIIPSDYLADLTVHFQRLLTFSEHSSKRSRYDSEIKAILKELTGRLVIPLKQLVRQAQTDNLASQAQVDFRGARAIRLVTARERFQPTAFVAHSFDEADGAVVRCITQTLEGLGIRVVTGEKPKADRISEKVKERIDGQYMFVGIFTRRDKIAQRDEWTTSPWLIDEKAYAVGKGKKLILFKEKGVGSIGGIQGDYEFVEFSRDHLQDVVISLISMFDTSSKGLR